MRFYFKKESLKRYFLPIYWHELGSFIEQHSQDANESGYACITCGDAGKSCLFYENLSERKLFSCDVYIALDPNLRIPKEDFYLSSALSDEEDDGRKVACLFPTGTSLEARENAEEIWIITDEDVSAIRRLLQQEICSIAQLHGTVKVFSSQAFERSDNNLKEAWGHCKKLISFSKNKALNHWLRLLLGEDFILYCDDGSSPIRYAETHIQHPFLKEQNKSPYDEACLFKYGTWTSALRSLNLQLDARENLQHAAWSPQESLMALANQCLDSKQEGINTLFRHLIMRHYYIPFSLPQWQTNKNSLLSLMNFTKKHPQNEDMQRLLVTYLINFLHQEHWYKIERFFAFNTLFSDFLHQTVEVLSKSFGATCLIDFAYGTYLRSIQDQQKYTCGWEQNLATCFDFALDQNFDPIMELAGKPIKEKTLSGVKLTKSLLTPLLGLKKDVPKELISVCRKLIDLDDINDENIYGKSIFYRALLYLLEGDKEALESFLNQKFDPVKTRGYLGILGLFLLKYDTSFTEIGKRLLSLEQTELLSKKPLALQIKAWGELILGDKSAYETCVQLLAKDKTYFKQCDTFTEKWFIQAKIEEILGHKDRAKRFLFLHNNLGMKPCIWEMFE